MKKLKGIKKKLATILIAVVLGTFAGSGVANAHWTVGSPVTVTVDGYQFKHWAEIETDPGYIFYSETRTISQSNAADIGQIKLRASLFSSSSVCHSFSSVVYNTSVVPRGGQFYYGYSVNTGGSTLLFGWGDARYWDDYYYYYQYFDCTPTVPLWSHI